MPGKDEDLSVDFSSIFKKIGNITFFNPNHRGKSAMQTVNLIMTAIIGFKLYTDKSTRNPEIYLDFISHILTASLLRFDNIYTKQTTALVNSARLYSIYNSTSDASLWLNAGDALLHVTNGCVGISDDITEYNNKKAL